ncbi:TetR/AcrR family transcriptional regulator [Rhizobium glycinendophyticum]|uniref:TetR/AcrR family transcriptional regulator n=1 Tax=Rhizobium glycinendophyticum TaxID=2589807 RepID=A0A504U5W0_9HYPH|nr:TetR/AcrR family transcriptional regulator [Rhizobium glycinendophyticum]TPP10404.1 TetR/AcrR family transcriptional regulator [Rhizobium glycinendophyticum]
MKPTGTAMTRVGRPSKAAQDAASEKIMAVAMELFADRGFAGTSMEQVASRCGMGKDTLYRRFPSKVALFEAVVEHAHRRAVDRLADMRSAAEEPLPRLKALMQAMLHMNMDADLIALKRITFSETVVFEKREPFPRQPDPIMDRLIDAVRAAQAAGSIRAGDPAALANHLIHCLVALPTSIAMLGGDAYDDASAVQAHFDITWLWLMEGVSAQASNL